MSYILVCLYVNVYVNIVNGSCHFISATNWLCGYKQAASFPWVSAFSSITWKSWIRWVLGSLPAIIFYWNSRWLLEMIKFCVTLKMCCVNATISDFPPLRNCCVKMTQQMQNLHLCQSKKHSAPSSPNAAKRLYRNLSEKLKGSHSSFDEAYFRTRTDRLSLRKTSVVIKLFLFLSQFDLCSCVWIQRHSQKIDIHFRTWHL